MKLVDTASQTFSGGPNFAQLRDQSHVGSEMERADRC